MPAKRMLSALVPALTAAALAWSAAKAQEVNLKMDVKDYPLDQVRLGRQVWGERLSRLDFEKRVVVAYTWGITCPLSTGGISVMNDLYEKYKDRGLVVVGFQCRRYPWIIENNLVYACHIHKPAWPVVRRGWVSPWPVRIMPWVAVFDHTGEMVFAGDLKKLEPKLVAALDAAPDYLVGGPYKEIADVAGAIAADRQNVGSQMMALRKLAGNDETSAAAKEARAALARLEAYAENRLAKAVEQPADVVARVRIYEALSAQFEGDEIADRAVEAAARVLETCNFEEEESAYDMYESAWETFRTMPPAGDYAYSMDYTLTSDPLILARRRRMITEFRWAMLEITEWYPATYAGDRAVDALTYYPAPPMTLAEAEAQLETAVRLVGQSDAPLRMYEGRLQLQEIIDGYTLTDRISSRAMELADSVWGKDGKRIAAGADEYGSANETVQLIRGLLREQQNRIPADEASEYVSHLEEISREAGEGSLLARQAAPIIAALRPLTAPDFRPAD